MMEVWVKDAVGESGCELRRLSSVTGSLPVQIGDSDSSASSYN